MPGFDLLNYRSQADGNAIPSPCILLHSVYSPSAVIMNVCLLRAAGVVAICFCSKRKVGVGPNVLEDLRGALARDKSILVCHSAFKKFLSRSSLHYSLFRHRAVAAGEPVTLIPTTACHSKLVHAPSNLLQEDSTSVSRYVGS